MEDTVSQMAPATQVMSPVSRFVYAFTKLNQCTQAKILKEWFELHPP